ncbi:MAG: hypothetical protein SAJ37_15455 [Oscillatoria sp. PMC 1068.18]|nr:hypothetical protein [Oscillatoria sp. PMC 1068.18]
MMAELPWYKRLWGRGKLGLQRNVETNQVVGDRSESQNHVFLSH